MAKINLLPAKVYNRIAAGEVVERPFSAVKELVENSLDAGATEIEIRIERGGRDLIEITDNGCGIERDDLRSAFLPHATSKIKTADDLNCIETLGFRGEAIASIASVSKMKILSKVKDEPCYSIECNGGEIGFANEEAGVDGTTVSVANLFFNTPARAKFLKSDKAEEADISAIVARFILGNPDVSFRYFTDGKLTLQSFGMGLDEGIASVYGAATLQKCFKIKTVKNGISIRGYVGNTNFYKPNRSYQSTFVNGRYVTNATLVSALTNAYSGYLMKRQYPFYVLFIDLPSEVVDVNVHPNKADVRFADNKVVYGAVYSVVSAVLDGSSAALDFVVAEAMPKSTIAPEDCRQRVTEVKSAPVPEVPEPKVSANPVIRQDVVFTYEEAKRAIEKIKSENKSLFSEREVKKSEPSLTVSDPVTVIHESYEDFGRKDEPETKDEPEADVFAENKRFLEELEKKKAQQPKIEPKNYEYKGNLFSTYLIYECGDEAYLIDQHAAHERLIFDSLCEKMQKKEIVQQPMLVPYILQVNYSEAEFLRKNAEIINSLGFCFEEFGENAFKVSAVPTELQSMQIGTFFDELLKDISGLQAIRMQTILRDKIASTACKHAIKGGMQLTDAEVELLFEKMQGNMGLKCPHGRPVAVRLTKTEVEKLFKRIV